MNQLTNKIVRELDTTGLCSVLEFKKEWKRSQALPLTDIKVLHNQKANSTVQL